VVLLSGTAGLGQSTLTEVLRAQVRAEGWPHIVGAARGTPITRVEVQIDGDHGSQQLSTGVRKPNLRGSSDPWSGRMPRQGNIQSAAAISGA
jgi:hypothetical protein